MPNTTKNLRSRLFRIAGCLEREPPGARPPTSGPVAPKPPGGLGLVAAVLEAAALSPSQASDVVVLFGRWTPRG
eukprot:7367964-Pyramimonas_sp.AAC.1